MPLAPSFGNQNKEVVHYGSPFAIVDFPSYVSVQEWAGTVPGNGPITATSLVLPPLGTGVAQPYGTGTTDDSTAINFALLAIGQGGGGQSLYFPSGTYLVSANAIVNTYQVPCVFAPGATVTGTYAASLNGFAASQAFKARAVMTSITSSTTYLGTGTSKITLGSNGALPTQDGVSTLAVGDTVLFAQATFNGGSLAWAAKDNGPWIVTSLGAAGAPPIFTRPTWWPTGGTIPVLQQITVGPEGTVFHGTTWSSWAAGGTVIGTTDPALYPDRIVLTATLAASTFPLNFVPLRSATLTSIVCAPNGGGATVLGTTVGYGVVTGAAFTPGYVPTGSAVIDALAAGQTKSGTTDTSIISITVTNR